MSIKLPLVMRRSGAFPRTPCTSSSSRSPSGSRTSCSSSFRRVGRPLRSSPRSRPSN